MATLKIEEIHITSIGGWAVVLTGVDPTDSDFIIGTITTPGQGVIRGTWNDVGILRGGPPSGDGNIHPSTPDVAELIALAKQLGAP
jgi:hypothetical protein